MWMLVAVLVVLVVIETSALRPTFLSSRFTASKLHAKNVIDGVEINGDLIPISNNVLVRVKEPESATKGGLFIPDNAKERPTEGVVIAAGPGRIHSDTGVEMDVSVKPGDRVLYGKYDGTELKYNGANHQLIKDDDVLLKFSGDALTLSNVEPVKDQVLVRLLPKEDKTASGIVISTPGQDKRPSAGIVVKVGPGRQANNGNLLPMQVNPGDGVRFREYGGNQVKIEGIEYMIVRVFDIVARWTP